MQVFFEVVIELLGDGVGWYGLIPIEQPASGENVGDVVAGVKEAEGVENIEFYQRDTLHFVHLRHHSIDIFSAE